MWKKVLLIKNLNKNFKNFKFKNKLKISNLNNYKNLSKSNLNDYKILSQKLYEKKKKFENNHKNLVNTKKRWKIKFRKKWNEIYENIKI